MSNLCKEDIDEKIENQIIMICSQDEKIKIQNEKIEILNLKLEDQDKILEDQNKKLKDQNKKIELLRLELREIKKEFNEQEQRKLNKVIRSYSIKNNPKSPQPFKPMKLSEMLN